VSHTAISWSLLF